MNKPFVGKEAANKYAPWYVDDGTYYTWFHTHAKALRHAHFLVLARGQEEAGGVMDEQEMRWNVMIEKAEEAGDNDLAQQYVNELTYYQSYFKTSIGENTNIKE